MNQPLSEEETQTREVRAKLGGAEAQINSMIQERVEKVTSIKQAIAQRQEETRHLAKTVKDLTTLVKKIEGKQKDVDAEAEKVVQSIENELADLIETQTQLKGLKVNDARVFLQSYPKTLQPIEISLSSELEMHELRKSLRSSLSKLQVYIDKTAALSFSGVTALKYVQQFAINVSLDHKTAHHRIILSEDLKQVRFNPDMYAKPNPISNPARFTKHLAVLGRKGIQSGKFYFEVFVGPRTKWIVGVALASLQRKGKIPHAPGCGVFALCFRMDYFETFCQPNVQIHQGKMEKVGVFVDYDAQQVSFYDVNAAKLIYTFEDCAFDEKIYPYFNPCNNEFGGNLGPLVLVPVTPK